MSLRSSVSATIIYQDGELIANLQGLDKPQKSITVSRSSATNIIFRNATEGEFRLVVDLGKPKTENDDSHHDVDCTQLVETGGEQSLTLNIAKSSSAENHYKLFIAGAEDKQIEVVVP